MGLTALLPHLILGVASSRHLGSEMLGQKFYLQKNPQNITNGWHGHPFFVSNFVDVYNCFIAVRLRSM
jgi:hypothetical protein